MKAQSCTINPADGTDLFNSTLVPPTLKDTQGESLLQVLGPMTMVLFKQSATDVSLAGYAYM